MSRRNIYIPEMSKEVQDKMFKDHMLEKWCSACVFPWVYETLHTLHQQGIQLFVLSSDSYETLLPEIEKAWLTWVFTEVYGCAHEKDIILTEIITHYHLDPETTLLVWDTSGEVFAGRKNGVKTAGISRWFQTKKRLEEAKPDYLINTIEEILSIV
jgi:phosphoglycolate phosphatase-like HAD superfamily hydrolase